MESKKKRNSCKCKYFKATYSALIKNPEKIKSGKNVDPIRPMVASFS